MSFLGIAIVSTLLVCAQSLDGPESPYIIETESLPDDLNIMPTLGNGDLGFTMFSDSIFMNGVYNGQGGLSHRARIPNIGNITVVPIGAEGYTNESYKLDLYNGIFERKQSNSDIETIVRTYPHRYFNRAIINEIFVQRKGSASAESDTFKFLVDILPGNHTDDFIPISILSQSPEKANVYCTQTKEAENANFTNLKPYVCIAMNSWPTTIELLPNETIIHKHIVMTFAENSRIANKELNDVLATSDESLLKSHTSQWNAFWNQFHIDLDGNLDLARTINTGIFYIASSLPSAVSNQPSGRFFGLSPSGLGRGNLENDYQGHNFWDTEIWMFPAVTQLSTHWAKELLGYRFHKLDGAKENAKQTGYRGARFPWESAYTGTEVTNPCCPEVAAQQFHITADIAFAARHYYAITNNTLWMETEGCELAQKIAEFWIDRVSVDHSTLKYDIEYVMGPDEDHVNVTNNAYTNVVASRALEFVHSTKDICGTKSVIAELCLHIAQNLKVPFDPVLDYHPQYEGYTPNITIKQADAVLLSYPLLYPMNVSTLANNLRIYENVTRASGPAMTWSMHAIGHLDEGDSEKAAKLFERGYRDYVREPYKVWSEVVRGKEGASNFITGIGGFLQAIINGYGGVRFHTDRMEVKKPMLLPGTKSGIISGIKYQGSTFTIKLSSEPTIRVDSVQLHQALLLMDEENDVPMVKGTEYPINRAIYIKATSNL